MTDRDGTGLPVPPERGARLAELTEEITRRLLAGEAFDAEAYAAENLDCAGPIRQLLPTMHSLADLGRTVGRRTRRGPRENGSQPFTEKDPLS